MSRSQIARTILNSAESLAVLSTRAASSSAVTTSEKSALPTARSSQSKNDLRSTSGLGLGDGLTDHTSKWMSEKGPSPMELIARVPPKKVHTPVVACFGHPDPNLGHEIEYIKVLGHGIDNPAVCKFCGLRYYDDHHH